MTSSQFMDGRIHWTDKARRKVYPAEGKPLNLAPPDELWKQAGARVQVGCWMAGLGMNTPSLRVAVKSALHYLQDPSTVCEDPGIVFCMLERDSGILDYWFSTGQEHLALRALVG